MKEKVAKVAINYALPVTAGIIVFIRGYFAGIATSELQKKLNDRFC